MIKKGQIVEIPSTSAIYAEDRSVLSSKKDELIQKVIRRNYDLFDGFLVGEHQGVEHFRLGQRKGINVGGKNAPLYVIGINEATNQVKSYFATGTNLMYAIGAIIGLVGAIKVYKKWNDGEHDTGKVASSWFGSCIFLVVVATVLKSFFGV